MAILDFSKFRKGNLVKPDLEDARDLLQVLKEIEKEMQDIAAARKKAGAGKGPFDSGDELDDFQKEIEETNALFEEHERLRKAIIKQQAKIDAGIGDQAKELTKLKVIQQESNKEAKEAAKEALGLTNEYQKQSKRLNALRKEYKGARIEQGKSTKETRKLLKEITKLDRELKEVDADVGQFQRNVGDYEKAVSSATTTTLGWAAALIGVGTAAEGVNKTIESNEATSKDAAGLAAGIGAAFDVLANRAAKAGTEILDLGKAIVTGNVFFGRGSTVGKGLSDSIDGLGDSLGNAFDAAKDASDAAFELQRSQLALREEVARLNAEIEEQSVIAGDSTKAFEEQEAAIFRVAKAQIARTAILRDIAKQELAIIETQISATEEEANILALQEAASEKRVELIELEGELTAQQLDNDKAAREVARDRFEIELDFAIDAFDAQKTVNERRIADDRKTLSERQSIFEETVRLAESSFSEQIKLTEGFLGQQTDLNELVLIEDERIIRERLKAFTADEITLTRILEIIRERKLLTQDIADLERDLADVAIEQAERRIAALRALEQEQVRGQREALERQLTNDELAAEERSKLTAELFKKRRQDLLDQAAFEEATQDATAEEILVIREKLKNDLLALRKEEKDAIEAIDREQVKERIQAATELVSALAALELEASEKRLDAIDDQISAVEKRQEQLAELAARGSEDARSNLATEQKKEAELRQDRERELRRQQRIELGLTALNTYNSKVQAGEKNALGKTIRDITLLTAFVQSLPSFYEGIEDTGTVANPIDSKGGRLAVIHNNERILDGQNNSKTKGLSNDQLADLGHAYLNGRLMYPEEFEARTVVTRRFNNDADIVGSVEKVAREVHNLADRIDIPEGRTDYDALEQAIVKTVETRHGKRRYWKPVNRLY